MATAFGGNERYAKQHLLGLYQRLPAPLRQLAIEPLLFSIPGAGALPLLRKIRSYVEQARPPMPLRYESYNLLQHFGVENVFTPEYLDSVDARHPLALLADAHAPFAGASLINQMLAIDLRFILADGDLPKVAHMCNLAEVDVTFPLLDDRIVEFASHLPHDWKLRGMRLRWFFKKALSDFLPPEIIAKKKHGFGLPGRPLAGCAQALFCDGVGQHRVAASARHREAGIRARPARSGCASTRGTTGDGLGSDDARSLARFTQTVNAPAAVHPAVRPARRRLPSRRAPKRSRVRSHGVNRGSWNRSDRADAAPHDVQTAALKPSSRVMATCSDR
jgi:hypothetical protein